MSLLSSANETQARRDAVARALKARRLDALVVSAGPNLRYLTGFTGSHGLLLLTQDDPLFLTNPIYRLQAGQEVSCKIQVGTRQLMDELAPAARKRRIRTLGFEAGRITFEAYSVLKSKLARNASLEPVAGLIERLRMVKSPAEIALIRGSVETNSRAYEKALSRLRPSMTETEFAAELEFRMRRFGAEKPAFDTIVASGPRTALPHAQPTDARLAAGGTVLIDMGAFQAGYASDMTRMFFVGKPSPRMKSAYAAVLEAQLAAIDAVRPGVKSSAVDRAARNILKAHKLDRYFVHSTGHGLGLEIHEPPRLGMKDHTKLEAGMAITIEPGVYLEGVGGIRIEDTVLVTGTGCEVLTPTDKALRVV
jgi:Xaa-Pro aminopeptidase